MNFSNLSLLIVILLTALMIYWLIKRTFNQANTIQKLEQDIAQMTARQLEREIAFHRQLDIGIKKKKSFKPKWRLIALSTKSPNCKNIEKMTTNNNIITKK